MKTPEEIKAKKKAYRLANKERLSAYFKQHYQANRAEKIAKSKSDHKANKVARNAQKRVYAEENKALIAARKRERYQATKDAVRLKGIAYRAANKREISARKKVYHDANKAALYAQKKVYCQENKEQIAAQKRASRLANPVPSRAGRARRRARKRSAGGSFTATDLKALMVTQKKLCIACRVKLDSSYEADHRVPLALGGSNEITNMQLLCMPCNRSKGAKHPIDFMQQRGYLL